jgi:lactate dehydrogenase-like 2-hydroxyacid dehydrogenase
MKALVTDAEYSSLDVEADVLAAAGHELRVAACKTAEDVIEAGAGVDAMLVQYAPITAAVFEALPQLRLVSRYGVGVDAVDTDAAQRHRVWVCNVPDYGTTEVALHAVAMLLALLRNVAGHDRAVCCAGRALRPWAWSGWAASDGWQRSARRHGSGPSLVTTPTCRIRPGLKGSSEPTCLRCSLAVQR